MDTDVTTAVEFDAPDEEVLPLRTCVCGTRFPPWTFTLSIYRDLPIAPCPTCGRRLYFTATIHVYEIVRPQAASSVTEKEIP